MKQDLSRTKSEFVSKVKEADSLTDLEAIRVSALGRKGRITELMKLLGGMTVNERKVLGPELNALKGAVLDSIETRRTELEEKELEVQLGEEALDTTLPVASDIQGKIHPVSQVLDELVNIFVDMEFSVAEGPDIEDDWHNFTALNIPPNHPARQMHDTFYLAGDKESQLSSYKLLRTHTSPVQVRSMMAHKLPIRIIVPGRTYRSDSDQTHTPMFHQVEGLVIDETTHMGHLKGCLVEFVRTFFDIDDLTYRFRPSYFPFTEPSAEMDIGCTRNGGEVRVGGTADWLEILGCGMVNPRVLQNCGVDTSKYQGFAFGMGIDRLAMLKYGMPDLRQFFECDLRWLRHFGFSPLDVPLPAGRLIR